MTHLFLLIGPTLFLTALQALFDKAEYTFERMNGTQKAEEVRKELESYFSNKMKAARKLAATAVKAYDSFFERIERNETEGFNYTRLEQLPVDVYRDSDIPKRLDSMTFSAYFKQNTNEDYSTIKIADEVPRSLNHTIFAVQWTKELETLMQENRVSKIPSFMILAYPASRMITLRKSAQSTFVLLIIQSISALSSNSKAFKAEQLL